MKTPPYQASAAVPSGRDGAARGTGADSPLSEGRDKWTVVTAFF